MARNRPNARFGLGGLLNRGYLARLPPNARPVPVLPAEKRAFGAHLAICDEQCAHFARFSPDSMPVARNWQDGRAMCADFATSGLS